MGGAAPSGFRHAFHLAALVISAALPEGRAVIGSEAMETTPPMAPLVAVLRPGFEEEATAAASGRPCFH
jgi:hypothetical protein